MTRASPVWRATQSSVSRARLAEEQSTRSGMKELARMAAPMASASHAAERLQRPVEIAHAGFGPAGFRMPQQKQTAHRDGSLAAKVHLASGGALRNVRSAAAATAGMTSLNRRAVLLKFGHKCGAWQRPSRVLRLTLTIA